MKLSIFYSLVFSFLFFNLANASEGKRAKATTLSTNSNEYQLIASVIKGDIASVLELTSKMSNINIGDKYYHKTALMYASEYGHDRIVRALIEAGADVTLRSIGGNTALDYASAGGHTGIVSQLELAIQKLKGK